MESAATTSGTTPCLPSDWDAPTLDLTDRDHESAPGASTPPNAGDNAGARVVTTLSPPVGPADGGPTELDGMVHDFIILARRIYDAVQHRGGHGPFTLPMHPAVLDALEREGGQRRRVVNGELDGRKETYVVDIVELCEADDFRVRASAVRPATPEELEALQGPSVEFCRTRTLISAEMKG